MGWPDRHMVGRWGRTWYSRDSDTGLAGTAGAGLILAGMCRGHAGSGSLRWGSARQPRGEGLSGDCAQPIGVPMCRILVLKPGEGAQLRGGWLRGSRAPCPRYVPRARVFHPHCSLPTAEEPQLQAAQDPSAGSRCPRRAGAAACGPYAASKAEQRWLFPGGPLTPHRQSASLGSAADRRQNCAEEQRGGKSMHSRIPGDGRRDPGTLHPIP